MQEPFDYVVASHWDNGSKRIYTYHSEIQKGETLESAKNFLEYVKRRSPDEEWKIYKINYEEVT